MKRLQFLQVLILAAVGCFQTGCTTLTLVSQDPAEDNLQAALKESPEAALFRAVQTARESDAIVLQMQGADKPVRIIPLPKDEGTSVFMSDLLRQAGLLRRVRSLDVTLFRSEGQLMDGVKMVVAIDRKTKQVSTGTDYALRPGDRVQVRRKSNATMVQTIVDGVIPPVARQALRL